MDKKFLNSNPKQGSGSIGGPGSGQKNMKDDPKKPGRLYKDESSEEYLAKQVIYPIERVHLDRVFEELSNADPNK